VKRLLAWLNSPPQGIDDILVDLPPAERRRIWTNVQRKSRGNSGVMLFNGLLGGASGLVAQIILNVFIRPHVRMGYVREQVLFGVVIGIMTGLVFGISYRFVSIRLFREALAEELRRIGRCLDCGYDLRASPDKCPECGKMVVQS
jgi:hypothetical protein